MAIFSKENLSAARLGKILGFSLAPSLVIFFYFELQIIDISGFLVGLFIYTFLAGHLFGSVEVRTVIEKVTESTYQDVTTEKNLDKLNNEIEDLSKLINDVIERVIAFSKDQEGQEKGLQTLLNLHGELIKIDMENAESNYGDLIKKVEKGTSKFLKRIRDMEEFSGLISGNSTERGVFIKLIQEKVGLISKESGHSGKALQDILNAVDKVESDISGFMDYTTETIELVKKGRNLFLQTAEYIHQIKQGLTGSAEIIKNLNQKSIEIGQIVNVIENISDKTKLLALNNCKRY